VSSALSIDFETRSEVDLTKCGVYPYAQSASTDIWCMAWAFEGEEPELWTPHVEENYGCSDPNCEGHGDAGLRERIVEHILSGGEIRAWNAQFERVIWNEIMVKRYGAPPVKLEQWVDTAAEAAALSLPRALEDAARVVNSAHKKDTKGHNLMRRMSRPRSYAEDGTPVWWDEPEKLQQLYEYCKQDVRTEMAIAAKLRRLTPHEQRIYWLDQRINDRGIQLDVPLVRAARRIVDIGVERAEDELARITAGNVASVTNHADLRNWLRLRGVDTPSVDKAHVAELLSDPDLDADVRRALNIKANAGRSSVAKLVSMLDVVSRGDRLRGLLLYHGAGTGRWSGKLVQPQNFPRGEVKDVERFIPLVMAGDYDGIEAMGEHPIVVVSSLLRAMLTAAPGSDLIAGDFSAVEARMLNWLAGQEDVLDAFRAYDAGDKSKDPYKIMAVRMGRALRTIDVMPYDRQAGKAAELGCGYGMGWKKFIKAAWQVYQVRVNEAEAMNAVDTYRATHPKVQQFWWDANNAVIRAVARPGPPVRFGGRMNLIAVVRGGFLFIILPSGRPIAYPVPRIVEAPTPWGELRPSVEVSGVNSYTRKWERQRLYGGLIVENIVQGASRDLLAAAMERAEAAGYRVVLSVHDENVSEVPKGFGSEEEFKALLEATPEWASGCPIAAETWRGERYRK